MALADLLRTLGKELRWEGEELRILGPEAHEDIDVLRVVGLKLFPHDLGWFNLMPHN